jgi:hypothetical protein
MAARLLRGGQGVSVEVDHHRIASHHSRVLEQTDEVGLAGLLERADGARLEAQVRLEVLRDLTDETLEGQLADEELRALLVATDLTQRDGTGLVAVGLLDCG